MEYSEDLVIQLDGLGIDMSKGPEITKQKITGLYEQTRENCFGYIEKLEFFNKEFEPVYGIGFFILVRNVYHKFMLEYATHVEQQNIKALWNDYTDTDMTVQDAARAINYKRKNNEY
jgi:hypothetical protein|tara:strand:- start:279 stop:629 length:351 start_codon:yes stop_codon:yes gene_type:complete